MNALPILAMTFCLAATIYILGVPLAARGMARRDQHRLDMLVGREESMSAVASLLADPRQAGNTQLIHTHHDDLYAYSRILRENLERAETYQVEALLWPVRYLPEAALGVREVIHCDLGIGTSPLDRDLVRVEELLNERMVLLGSGGAHGSDALGRNDEELGAISPDRLASVQRREVAASSYSPK